jgi:hypothetical protein
MSIVFMEGFDLYPAELFSNVSGTNWGTNAVALRILSFGRYGNRSIGYSGTSATGGGNFWTVPSAPTAYYWLNWSHRQSVQRDPVRYNHGIRMRHGNPSIDLAVILDRDLKAKMYLESTLVAETTDTYAIGEWVDMRMRVNILNGQITWYVNDTLVFDGFTPGYVGGAPNFLWIGNCFVPSSGSIISTGGFQIDDIILSFDGPDLGRTAVLYLRPNADEANQDFTPASGTDGFAMIDGNLPTGTVTDYIEATTVGDISQFDVADPSVQVFGLYAVQIQTYQIKTTTATTEVDLILTVNGTDFNSPAIGLSNNSYVLQDYIWDINPDTLAQWQTTDIPGLRMGFEKVS